MGIVRTEADVEKAHGEIFEETVVPDAKRRKVTASLPERKNVEPHPDVKTWLMEYAETRRRVHGWSTATSWRKERELAPGLFAGCNDQIFRRWRAVQLAETKGRHAILSKFGHRVDLQSQHLPDSRG